MQNITPSSESSIYSLIKPTRCSIYFVLCARVCVADAVQASRSSIQSNVRCRSTRPSEAIHLVNATPETEGVIPHGEDGRAAGILMANSMLPGRDAPSGAGRRRD